MDNNKLSSFLTYPVLVFGGLLAHSLLIKLGIGITYASYIPVTAALLYTLALEYQNPFNKDWRPIRSDLVADSLFLLLVQILLPLFVAWFITIELAHYLQANQITLLSVWPHAWPLWAQVLLMLFTADLLRYCLHRACHDLPFLWKLHAVHHAPKKLYSLNVGRFHPIEKGLQYLFDALPFLILNVNPRVIAIYFTFYAVNGFLQHSNLQLQLGPLNYLFSSAPLHRWHHAKHRNESNCNFGNNLAVWDLVFGTWYLPTDKQVTELGIAEDAYPTSHNSFLKALYRKQRKTR